VALQIWVNKSLTKTQKAYILHEIDKSAVKSILF
jgi:hypothetical protein